MRRMRLVNTIGLVGAWLGGAGACSSVLMSAPVSSRADGWAITLNQVKEGPNQYTAEGVAFSPERGEKFIWTLITVRSERSDEQTFSYDTCILEDRGLGRRPAIIDRNAEVNAPADRAEPFAPGEERTRKLVFRYVKNQRPSHMKCGSIVLAIEAGR